MNVGVPQIVAAGLTAWIGGQLIARAVVQGAVPDLVKKEELGVVAGAAAGAAVSALVFAGVLLVLQDRGSR